MTDANSPKNRLTRRDFVKGGSLGLLGITLLASDTLRMHAASATRRTQAPAKSVILVWLDGGPSSFETFDPKPNAPAEIRGAFGAIRTNVPGLHIGELLPNMARQMDKCTLFRTVTHNEGRHDRACCALLTGSTSPDGVIPPSVGAVAAKVLGGRGEMPPYVALPGGGFAFGYGQAGYLGAAFDPLSVPDDPNDPRFYQQHGNLVRSPLAIAQGFQLHREKAAVRERYGRHTFGQRCLLARRLVEAGVRFITVSHGGWDTHSDNARACQDWLVPTLDQGLSALLEDLHQRGRLAETLVVCMGEFGRTPQINPLAGRDHWSRTGFALFAGSGVPGGQAVGATDAKGAEPLDRSIAPQDIAAAIYAKLGIGWKQSNRTEPDKTDGKTGDGVALAELG